MTFDELFKLFRNGLPGEEAHLEFSPIRQKSSVALKNAREVRDAAVAIVIYPFNDELYSLVIERQTYDGTHSGQISFPGGKVEEFDQNLMQTAIRECYEEIGLQLNESDFISELTPVFIPVSGFHVRPFIFYQEIEPTNFILSEREVYQLAHISLKELTNDENVILRSLSVGSTILKDVPHFKLNEIEIWGATALMLNELKHVLKKIEL
ncbi:MAG: NUDIX hydrolase [Fluviicola sp.]|jgi:8-oxo-dGTP pyrophosphatase MutT (NUDIX family)